MRRAPYRGLEARDLYAERPLPWNGVCLFFAISVRRAPDRGLEARDLYDERPLPWSGASLFSTNFGSPRRLSGSEDSEFMFRAPFTVGADHRFSNRFRSASPPIGGEADRPSPWSGVTLFPPSGIGFGA